MEQYSTEIKAAPSNYEEWLECFEYLKSGNTYPDTIRLIASGQCVSYSQIKGYFNKQLVSTINAMIQKYINVFKKELQMYVEFNEVFNIYIPFKKLANKFSVCLFFTELDFLDEDFITELENSVINDITDFWNSMLDSLHKQYMEQNNQSLEEEFFRIKRVKLFRKYRTV